VQFQSFLPTPQTLFPFGYSSFLTPPQVIFVSAKSKRDAYYIVAFEVRLYVHIQHVEMIFQGVEENTFDIEK
jgi:hypothetical protein